MGLYLCIFDECGQESSGVEVGRYQYFAELRQRVAAFVDQGRLRDVLVLLHHMDCDGSWSTAECKKLLQELSEIRELFQQEPPSEEVRRCKEDVFKLYGVVPQNLFECFIDADCEFLLDRLMQLCGIAIGENRPIQFQ